jgi:hypothetical protein
MSSITTDNAFKNALNTLTIAQQRQVAAAFVESVLALCPQDTRIQNAIQVAKNPYAMPDELGLAYRAAKNASVETFTQCGRDADWLKQASHFVAEASAVCVTPEEQSTQVGNLAWQAAMHGRMARTCETIATGTGSDNDEAQQQYQLVDAFLKTIG